MSRAKKAKAKRSRSRSATTSNALQLRQAAFLLGMVERVGKIGGTPPMRFITVAQELMAEVATRLERGNRSKGGAK